MNEWQQAALRVGEALASSGPRGYYNFTADQWRDWCLAALATPAAPPRVEPTLVDEGDGEIALDWDRDNRRVLSLNIGQTGIGYSYLMGRETGSGRVTFGMMMPKRVIEVLRELSQPESAPTPGLTSTDDSMKNTCTHCGRYHDGECEPTSPGLAQDGATHETCKTCCGDGLLVHFRDGLRDQHPAVCSTCEGTGRIPIQPGLAQDGARTLTQDEVNRLHLVQLQQENARLTSALGEYRYADCGHLCVFDGKQPGPAPVCPTCGGLERQMPTDCDHRWMLIEDGMLFQCVKCGRPYPKLEISLTTRETPEQAARNMLERIGMDDAQSLTAGDVVELANILAEKDSIICPECGETVRLVSSATLSIALWQHFNWKHRAVPFKVCAHGHRVRQVGCVSCVLVFGPKGG